VQQNLENYKGVVIQDRDTKDKRLIDDKTILERLKEATYTPAKYKPSEEFVNSPSYVVFVNDKPILSIGYSDEDKEIVEATVKEYEMLTKSKLFKDNILPPYIDEQVEKMELKAVKPNELKLPKPFEYYEENGFNAISKKEKGEVVEKEEKGELHWIVFDSDKKEGLLLATALSIELENIEKQFEKMQDKKPKKKKNRILKL